MPIIYVDVLIAVNWVVDDMILSATACVLHMPLAKKRLLFAGLLGGVSGLLILLPPFSVALSLLIKLISACLLTFFAFPWRGIKSFAKTTTVFFIIAALFAGILSGIWLHTSGEMFLVRNGIVYFSISPLWIALFAGISYGVVRMYDRLTRKNAPQNCEYILRIENNGKYCTCRALYDTGLHLNEPFSGRPVIVVERTVIEALEDTSLCSCLQFHDTLSSERSQGIRLIPYHTLENKGLLPAFLPKTVTVCAMGQSPRDISGTYVAVTENLGRGEYRALIGNSVV